MKQTDGTPQGDMFQSWELSPDKLTLTGKLDPGIETIFLMTKDEYTFISSRQVKEICRMGGNVSDFVPRGVEKSMKRRFGSKRSV